MEKIYTIEKKDTWHGVYYRFHSNYNGAVGVWNTTVKGAEEDGKVHQRIITQLHISKGGNNTKENIVPACKSCNSRKNNKILDRNIGEIL